MVLHILIIPNENWLSAVQENMWYHFMLCFTNLTNQLLSQRVHIFMTEALSFFGVLSLKGKQQSGEAAHCT